MSQDIALVFPGQGSQSVGMLTDYAQQFPIVKETFAEASEVLQADLWQLVSQGPEGKLNQTEWTQPALLTASVAMWRVWEQQIDLKPVVFAGHSLGEYSALVAARALTLSEAVPLVAKRGQLMQAACAEGEGKMAAVLGLDFADVDDLCQSVSSDECHVAAANDNAPGQVVISGNSMAVEAAMKLSKERGAKRSVLLPVSVPSHCCLMKPAAQALQSALEAVNWQPPQIPVIHNADIKLHDSPSEMIAALTEQLYNPVRWVGTIQHLATLGVAKIIECGPGQVLTGLNRRITKEIECISISGVANLDEVKSQLLADLSS